MGTTVKQRAAMNVASPSFVVAFANNFATMCLSDFGAMSLTPGLGSDVSVVRFKEQPKDSL